MHNIKFIRNNPQGFKLLMEKRGLKIELEEIIDLDNLIRAYQTEIQEIQEKRNNTSKEIGKLVSEGHDISELQKNVSNFKSELTELDEKIKNSSNKLKALLITFPNYLEDDVPLGKDESQNELIKNWGEIPKFNYHPLDHVDLGEKLKGLDFKTGVKISGSRFVLLRGKIALLERALSSFMIDTHLNNLNFEEVSPPYIVKDAALVPN